MCSNLQCLFYIICTIALFFSNVRTKLTRLKYTHPLYRSNFRTNYYGFVSNNFARNSWQCYAKPIITTPVLSKDVLKKQVFLDYENILRSHDPSFINYNTRLSSIPGINIENIDNLYGRIYDRKVLLKQLDYFFRQDDFHTIYRILRDNPNVLTRVDCHKLVNSLPFVLKKVLKYPDLKIEKIDEQLRFLVGRYVLQHVIHQLPTETCRYHNLVDGKVPGDPVPNPQKRDFYKGEKAPIEEHPSYVELMGSLADLPAEIKFDKALTLQRRMIEAKRKKLERALWNFQKLKPPKHLSTRLKFKNHIDIKRINPLMSRPLRYTKEQYNQVNQDFATAVEKEDLVTACYILQRHTRLLDFRYKRELLKKFMGLHKKVHQCGLYPERSLKSIRLLYWRTMNMTRVLLKLREYSIIQDLPYSQKELYEKELEAYRKRRDQRNIDKMKAAGFDVDDINDFSNAYSEDWVPVIRPDEYNKAVEFAKRRAETIKKLFQSEVEEDLLKHSN
ncbi:conserved Plasmodium protein, unknown function [Babesia microti strain RI]|uniref:Uncharacterized protein n=1 Tax=Babesia microti (strain RI) TaxID=1133968 RepID=A0A1R4A9Y3_BABMR|nr:conserved Plasmodium protein, unknown function [Babesia microti strain RI]SJK85806.1 conserved Plasmodium protein, unknown function [Babesia microti strain RI]|eukprot:XP_021338025.1 conserved Plasmodium protein, unknown function [Babesia microti strain RI]